MKELSKQRNHWQFSECIFYLLYAYKIIILQRCQHLHAAVNLKFMGSNNNLDLSMRILKQRTAN